MRPPSNYLRLVCSIALGMLHTNSSISVARPPFQTCPPGGSEAKNAGIAKTSSDRFSDELAWSPSTNRHVSREIMLISTA
jgi:hypothetical protein